MVIQMLRTYSYHHYGQYMNYLFIAHMDPYNLRRQGRALVALAIRAIDKLTTQIKTDWQNNIAV